MQRDEQFAARLVHDRHRQMYDYWLAKSPPGGLPGRQHIDPVEIPQLLPWISLVNVIRGPEGLGFSYRLVGTGIVGRAGRDATGKHFEELYKGEYLRVANTTYGEIVRQGRPFLSERSWPMGNKDFLRYDRLILPLAADGRTVDMLVLNVVFHEDEARLPRRLVGVASTG